MMISEEGAYRCKGNLQYVMNSFSCIRLRSMNRLGTRVREVDVGREYGGFELYTPEILSVFFSLLEIAELE